MRMVMMLLFIFSALWILQLHIIDVGKIQDFQNQMNDTMFPGFFMLNTYCDECKYSVRSALFDCNHRIYRSHGDGCDSQIFSRFIGLDWEILFYHITSGNKLISNPWKRENFNESMKMNLAYVNNINDKLSNCFCLFKLELFSMLIFK